MTTRTTTTAEVEVTRLDPGVSRAVEPESPAAIAMKRAIEKRKGAAMPKGVPGSGLSDEERKAKKAAYMKAYSARRAAEAKSGETPPRKKYARRAGKKPNGAAVVHVPREPEQLRQDAPVAGLAHMISEGHRLMDRVEALFGKR